MCTLQLVNRSYLSESEDTLLGTGSAALEHQVVAVDRSIVGEATL